MANDKSDNFADFEGSDDIFGDDMDWGSDDSLGGNDSFAEFDLDDQDEPPSEEMFDHRKKDGEFGPKTIAVIVAILFMIVAGVILVFSSISVEKKPSSNQQVVTQVPESSEVPESTEVPDKVEDTEGTIQDEESNGGMLELPADTNIDYTGSVYETSGTIHNKIKFLENSQVIYCVQISAKIGESTKVLNYYCGYNVYNSVSEGDSVTVSYQLVSDTCYSVNTISK